MKLTKETFQGVSGRTVLFLLPLCVAALLLALSSVLKSGPVASGPTAKARPVRVLTMAEVPFSPQVSGYGAIAPVQEWRAIARIDGEVVEFSPGLANGQQVAQGETLLVIDDTDVRLQLAEIDARLASLDTRDAALFANRDIVGREAELAAADFKRKSDLVGRGAVSQTVLEQAELADLAARSKLTDIANQLKLNGAERTVLNAEREQAARALSFATVRAPYDLLIGEVMVDLGQYVTRNQVLLAAEGIERAEVKAEVPMGQMGPMVRSLNGRDPRQALSATVRMTTAGHQVTWPARIARISEGIDPRTQSVGIIVEVDNP
ncbi:MAG: HlyD family efflux transporter periplasmic adaptor subunit, partial [Wenzhouxiangella sp.]|nr:HlyD family efflux transporter periplasmic adaptor subunit [Wenzhouxiangella sp.]